MKNKELDAKVEKSRKMERECGENEEETLSKIVSDTKPKLANIVS